jgi:GDPmannose 4,6-dehydratase
MQKKKAFITGIAGQDGSYLSEYLLEQGYEVYGILRRKSVSEEQHTRVEHLSDKITMVYGDVLDMVGMQRLLRKIQPDEIYNLAAQSHVKVSFEVPVFTVETNAMGVLYLLESMRDVCPQAHFYQASSSEMFGNNVDEDGCQRESTPMDPTSPYGCAKVFAYNLVRHYRNAYGLFAVNGILFNHESPRRGSNFVTSKVCKTAVEISKGLRDKLILGNMDSYRDWGHSRDYVRAMHMMLNHHEPDDFAIATGKTHSVRDLCQYVFTKLGMDYREYVVQDERYMRPEELDFLKGDASKARDVLGWVPEVSFEQLLDEMVEHWEERLP